MFHHFLYLRIFRPPDATLKKWQALEIRFGLVIFLVVQGMGGGDQVKKMFPHILYLDVFRSPDATLKRWQALEIRFGLVIFLVVQGMGGGTK